MIAIKNCAGPTKQIFLISVLGSQKEVKSMGK